MMPKEQLPEFKYFKDPLGVGVFKESDSVCLCCSQARGYIYTGTTYAEEELGEAICPWCIADGTASLRFEATFSDESGVGGYGQWDRVPEEVVQEIACRTPGIVTWQPESWWTHCGDGAVFVDYAGKDELLKLGGEVIQQLREDTGMDEAQWEQVFQSMQKDGAVMAYIFQCRHCGEYGGYWDCM